MAEPQLWVREEGKGEYLPARLCSPLSTSPRPEADVQAPHLALAVGEKDPMQLPVIQH